MIFIDCAQCCFKAVRDINALATERARAALDVGTDAILRLFLREIEPLITYKLAYKFIFRQMYEDVDDAYSRHPHPSKEPK